MGSPGCAGTAGRLPWGQCRVPRRKGRRSRHLGLGPAASPWAPLGSCLPQCGVALGGDWPSPSPPATAPLSFTAGTFCHQHWSLPGAHLPAPRASPRESLLGASAACPPSPQAPARRGQAGGPALCRRASWSPRQPQTQAGPTRGEAQCPPCSLCLCGLAVVLPTCRDASVTPRTPGAPKMVPPELDFQGGARQGTTFCGCRDRPLWGRSEHHRSTALLCRHDPRIPPDTPAPLQCHWVALPLPLPGSMETRRSEAGAAPGWRLSPGPSQMSLELPCLRVGHGVWSLAQVPLTRSLGV